MRTDADMTPEERFTKIENFLLTVAENQADHDERFRQIEGWMARHEDWMSRHEEQMAELRRAEQSMWRAIARVAEASQRTEEALRRAEEARSLERQSMEELHKHTEEKLHALIDAVDRMIRKDAVRKKPRNKKTGE